MTQPESVPMMPPKGNILIVDDDVFLSSLFGTVVERGGYTVTYARTGKEGVAEAETGKYDLILMDVMMPQMDGFEALTAIKANAATRHIPVVMLSSMSQQADVDRGMECGAVAFLAKQKVIPSETIATIEAALCNVEKPAVKTDPAPLVKKKAIRKKRS